jgi:hypothetical protein
MVGHDSRRSTISALEKKHAAIKGVKNLGPRNNAEVMEALEWELISVLSMRSCVAFVWPY